MPNNSFSKISDTEGVYDVKDSDARSSYIELNSKINNLKVESLSDTNVSDPTSGQSLVYDAESGKWVNSIALTKEWVGTLDELAQAIAHGDIKDDTNILVTDDYVPSGGSASSLLLIYSSVDSTVTVLKPDGINVIIPSVVSPGIWKCNLGDYGTYTIRIELAGDTYTRSFDMNSLGKYVASYSTSYGEWVIAQPSMTTDGSNAKSPVTFNSFVVGTSDGEPAEGSVSVGHLNKPQGRYSLANGKSNISSGESSHAEGFETQAIGAGSHTEGRNTVAGYSFQSVVGKYNNNKQTSLFEIGNGTSDLDRSNALEVDTDGNMNIAGEYRKDGNSVLDGWHPTNGVINGTSVTFTGCNDSYGYALYCLDRIATTSYVTKSGSGTNVTLVYTVDDAVPTDTFKLRILR